MTTMKRMIRNSTIAIATLMVLAAPMTATSAHAGGKPKVHFGIYLGGGPGYGPAYGGPGYYGYSNPCRWLHRRWVNTGNPKWHWRYRQCMNNHF